MVDTTNFTDKTAFRGSTAGLHLVERFTRIDNDTIVYEFTADDPATWTAQTQLTRIKGPLFEFACHEGNPGGCQHAQRRPRSRKSGRRGSGESDEMNLERKGRMSMKAVVLAACASLFPILPPARAHHAFAAEFDIKARSS